MISDADLLQKIRQSPLGDAQKTELSALMGQMTEAQRTELLNLIGAAQDEIGKAEADYQRTVNDLNKEYITKLDLLMRDETKKAIKAFEAAEQTETSATLQSLEQEIKTIKVASSEAERPLKKNSRHPLVKLTLAALALTLTYLFYRFF